MSQPFAEPAAAGRQKILVVDDEERIVRFVSRGLSAAGYDVSSATGGMAGLESALAQAYDLVILDLLMPDLDGMAVLRRLTRHRPGQPVIVLSCLTDTPSKVRSLGLGASDFIAKPFSFDELLARVRAQLRTAARAASQQVAVGRIRLNLDELTADGGSGPVALTKREFLLLREMARHPGRAVSKEQLLSSVWGLHFDPRSNVVDVFVGRLRAKLGNEVVETVRKEGYRLAVD